ncbi:MAG: hypothetical protein EPO40_06080 [Myxococcaceae bacterium]|nr:MAG: hypothetical protein EPO40_06080 [Myxococcaceae bacterium]
MSEETRKSVEAFAPLLTREELMELDTESLVEKVIGLRGDLADDAEEMADLRAALERTEASLATTRDIAQRLRNELAQAKYECTEANARWQKAETENTRLRSHLAAVLPFEQGHGHDETGIWDKSNGPPDGGKPCLQCHVFADAREAIGLPRWKALPEGDESGTTTCRKGCGCKAVSR